MSERNQEGLQRNPSLTHSLTRLPCCFCFMPVSSFIIFSNSAFSSASFCLCSAIFSLNLRGFDDIDDDEGDVATVAAAAAADMFEMGDAIAPASGNLRT